MIFTSPDGKDKMASVGEVSVIFLVVFVGLAEHVARRKASGERRPRQTHRAKDEMQVRLVRRPDDDRQQVPCRIDQARPELDEREIVAGTENASLNRRMTREMMR